MTDRIRATAEKWAEKDTRERADLYRSLRLSLGVLAELLDGEGKADEARIAGEAARKLGTSEALTRQVADRADTCCWKAASWGDCDCR